jgi:hypothetical protein
VIAHTIAAQTHGRYLVDAPAGNGPFALLVGFHGYGEAAAEMMDALLSIRGAESFLQSFHQFDCRQLDDA